MPTYVRRGEQLRFLFDEELRLTVVLVREGPVEGARSHRLLVSQVRTTQAVERNRVPVHLRII